MSTAGASGAGVVVALGPTGAGHGSAVETMVATAQAIARGVPVMAVELDGLAAPLFVLPANLRVPRGYLNNLVLVFKFITV